MPGGRIRGIVPRMRRDDGPRFAVIGICTLWQADAPSPAAQLQDNLDMMDAMAKAAEARGWRLDLALLPEVSFKFAEADVRAAAEDADGNTVQAIGRKACELGAYATAPILRRTASPWRTRWSCSTGPGNPSARTTRCTPS